MSTSDEWRTPQWLFEELNEEFNFDIDLCATRENSKCRDYCIDYLTNYWVCALDRENSTRTDFKKSIGRGQFIKTAFMNPPYSDPKPFIEKAWEDSKYCKIVCLVKCDPSTEWWATFWDYMEVTIKCFNCNEGLSHKSTTGGRYPCDICSLKGYIVKKPGPKPGCEVRFFPKRIKFVAPKIKGQTVDLWKKQSGPTFVSALVIMDRGGIV